MEILHGIAASKGISINPGILFQSLSETPRVRKIADVSGELDTLKNALKIARDELSSLSEETLKNIGKEEAEIFNAQLMMLEDPDLIESVEQKIRSECINCDAAIFAGLESYAKTLEDMADEYFRARAADVRDVSRRVIRIINKEKDQEYHLDAPTIILAEELTPSDTMRFDRSMIAGFFTARGGATSHTAILSKALGVPAVVGSGKLPAVISPNKKMILDGEKGLLIIDPDEIVLAEYQTRSNELRERSVKEKQNACQPAVTADEKRVEVVANIGNIEDANRAVLNGAEGVGLFRTEFSYIEKNSIPSEAELVPVYSEIFHVFKNCPVVIRTLDIGGDKEIAHLQLPVELNPFLGVRGIRLCFDRPDLFKPHLRAILRAGIGVDLRIMFPMISSIQEVRKARMILNECMAGLKEEGLPYNPNPQIGIMVEVPAAAVCSDQLAREVDFFSIGTNDLTQYTLAADRTNANLKGLDSAFHPAVLRLIKMVIENAHAAGIWVGLCGELAGEPTAIPILLGLGLDEFSMNSPAIPRAKEILRKLDSGKAKLMADHALLCETPEEIETCVNNWLSDNQIKK